MTKESRRAAWRELWRQLPFFVWLILLWMLLWGSFTVLSLVTGIGVALFVTRVFRLPPVEMSGRVNVWHLFVYVVLFLWAVVVGALQVTWQVFDWRRQPGAAILAVPMLTDDDLIMTHVGVTASLIPGSLVVDTDRNRRIIYLHVIGVRTREDLERQREDVQRWERRIIRALGSHEQLAALKAAQREHKNRTKAEVTR